jgi:succinyl-diaminopimelate desuccinylase
MESPLLQAVSSHRQAMLELTQQLVTLPTENPPGNAYAQAIELLCHKLAVLGFTDTHTEGECVLSSVGEGDRTLYFRTYIRSRPERVCFD